MGEVSKQNKTLSSFIWRFLERCGAQLVTFIVSIVLARLLDPTVYGTVAIVTVLITILQVFVDSGLGNALIQKKDADELDFSTVFFFNIGMCLLLYAIIFFCAPLIASFYEIPVLTPIIRVLSITLVISGVRNVQQAYVSRNMLFKKFFFSTIGGSIGAAVVGIGMAYAGYGVWALVGQQIFNTLVGTIVLWIVVKWKPKWRFSFQRLKGLFSFGWKLLISALIDTLYNNIRALIIGKKYSSSDLAYYDKGKQFPHLIVTNVNTSIDSVLLPTMSKEQDDKIRVKAMTRRAIRTSSYIMAPLMIGLAVCANSLVRLLLTDKWLDCVLFLQIFCVTYLFYPIHTANLNAIKAMGRSDMFLKLEIVKKIVGVVSILITMWISVEAMAYSLLVTTLLSSIINAFPNKKLLDYSWVEQMKDILPNIGLAVTMGIPVYFIGWLPLPTIVVLLIQIVVGAIIYIGLSVILKLEIFAYLLNTMKGFLKKKNKENKDACESIKMKKILLLGGSAQQVVAIETAKKLGYYTVLCDYLDDNPGQYVADKFYLVSTTDKNAVLDVATKENVDGILAYASDPAAPTAAYVAEKLGLPTNPYKSVEILCEKDKFREFIKKNRFNTPKAKGYDSIETAIIDCKNREFNYPIIVKPVDSSGSKGVIRIDDIEDVSKKLEYAMSFSRNGRIIIEEFVEKYGYQIAGDGLSIDGTLVFRCFANDHFNPNCVNPFVPISASFPYVMPEEVQQKIHAEIQRLITLLGIKNCTYNFDIRIDKDFNVYLMEIAPRDGGNYIPQIIRYATGVDLIEYSVKIAMGEKLDNIKIVKPDGYWSYFAVHSLKNGIIKEIKIKPEVIKNNIVENHIFRKERDEVLAFTGANTTLGCLIMKFDSSEQMIDMMDNSDKWIEVVLE